MPVERRRYSPDSALASAELRLLFWRVLLQAVRRVGHYGADATVLLTIQPIETVRMDELRSTNGNWLCPRGVQRDLPLDSALIVAGHPVNPSLLAHKEIRRVEAGKISPMRLGWDR